MGVQPSRNTVLERVFSGTVRLASGFGLNETKLLSVRCRRIAARTILILRVKLCRYGLSDLVMQDPLADQHLGSTLAERAMEAQQAAQSFQ